ncbi:MAG: hypothetical protein HYV15_07210, partial [Elusimicrobia bacterium]|nr:hypothetical protein [Elusimicrobiota bacterium]
MRDRAVLLTLCAALAAAPAAAQIEPPSSIRVVVSSAQVAGLDCPRRPFAWEMTRGTGRWYRYMAGSMITEGLDPRPILMGIVSAVMLTPVFIAAVPADLVSAPFRKSCSFTLKLDGRLAEWAGRSAGALPFEAEAVNLLETEVPEVKKAEWAVFKASTASDAAGLYHLEIAGHVGKSPSLNIAWRVKGQPAGQMLLVKKGKAFVLSEPDPGFGVGA